MGVNNLKDIVVVHYPRIDKLKPIFEYLHVALWTIGNKEIDDLRTTNNLSVIEWITRLFRYSSIHNFIWLGGKEINQTYSMAKLFQSDFKISINVLGLETSYSIEQLTELPDKSIIIYPGSILTNADFKKFIEFHHSHDKIASIMVNKGLQYRVGLAKIDNETNLVTEFLEKPYDKTLSAYMGIVALKSGWKKYLQDFLREIWKPEIHTTKSKITSSIDQFIGYLIDIQSVMVHELATVQENVEPWWIDLSDLEVWMKLDSELIFEKLKYLL
jgi:NDP-sugar pyrophosphorylase family protein